MARRPSFAATFTVVLLFLGLTYLMSTSGLGRESSPMRIADDLVSHTEHGGSGGGTASSSSSTSTSSTSTSTSNPASGISESILTGGSIAPKLENATAKADLGRASWKLFHTMMARFPERPTADDSLALKTYVQLFARLYPCGDCAAHFRKLLQRYPPQTSSRNAAAGWACFVHNEVNRRLKKPQFDCTKIGDFYDCGCGDDKKEKEGAGLEGRAGVSLEEEDGLARGG